MPMIRRFLILGFVVMLAGCGSQTSGQQDHTDVANLAQVFHQYNTAVVHDLAQQASVCKSARSRVEHVPPLILSHNSARIRKQAVAINSARADAVAGFRDCEHAAASLNYPLMVQALEKLAAANSQLAGARVKT